MSTCPEGQPNGVIRVSMTTLVAGELNRDHINAAKERQTKMLAGARHLPDVDAIVSLVPAR